MITNLTIGITGTGSLIGQAIIKSIIRSDCKTKTNLIGFDYFKDTVGAYWCHKNYILPDILKNGEEISLWLDFIIEKLIQNDVKLLFVGVDFELPLFAKYKDEIESRSGAIVMVSSEEVIRIANDKYYTYEFLKNNGLSCPLTFLPETIDFSKIEYPIIVKPRNGARSRGVTKVLDKSELEIAIGSIELPVIQECVGTENDEYTCGTLFLKNELKTMIILNRSLKEGNTFISHFRKDYPTIISEYLKQVCNILKPNGACNFQLRIDKNGLPKIFEINARHSGTTYIRSLFGYKEVEFIIDCLLHDKEYEFELKEGTVVRYYDEFFVTNNHK
jgi:carbamoyl-phosphate synthase large subunit